MSTEEAHADEPSWRQASPDADDTLPGLICFLDVTNTFVIKHEVKSLLQLMPASSGTGQTILTICEARSETHLGAVVRGRNSQRKDAKLMGLLGTIKTHELGTSTSLKAEVLKANLESFLKKHREDYDARAAARKQAAVAAAAETAASLGPLEVAGTYEVRTMPYPLRHKDCVEVWEEAQQFGHAPGIDDEMTGGTPSPALVEKTNLLSVLSVTAEGCAIHDKLEALATVFEHAGGDAVISTEN